MIQPSDYTWDHILSSCAKLQTSFWLSQHGLPFWPSQLQKNARQDLQLKSAGEEGLLV